jgi:hypothetical protein
MNKKTKTLLAEVKKTSSKINIKKITSINDLRDKEFEGDVLTEDEKKALFVYDRYRLLELNKQMNENEFNEKYTLLQVMANMRPYQDFLDSKYDYLFYSSL